MRERSDKKMRIGPSAAVGIYLGLVGGGAND